MPRRDSESDDSYRSRSRRKKSKKKSRRSSSSSPSTSRSSSSEKSKPRQYRCNHSRDRSKRRHKSSHSKRHRRRSRSSSSSDSRSRNKKHSSRTKERSRRSISRSHSRGRSSKTSKWSRSRSPSPKKSRNKEQVHKKDREIEGNSTKVSEEDMLREKLEAALKAAAMADAQLRQKGLLNDSPQKNVDPEMSVSQQVKRAQAIEDINSEHFTQQDFLSSRAWGNKSSKVSSEAPVETTTDSSAADDWRTNAEKLVHPSWFENINMKMDKWRKKLAELRSVRQNSDVGVL